MKKKKYVNFLIEHLKNSIDQLENETFKINHKCLLFPV